MTARGPLAAALGATAPAAEAHGFGQRYDLPLPLVLYVCGAALVVVLSCVLFAALVRKPPAPGFAQADLLATRAGRFLASGWVVAVLRWLVVALFLFVIVAGFVGNQNPFRNILPVAVWALWWVGLSYFSALVVDLWKLVNPLETIFALAERVAARRFGRVMEPRYRIPPAVGAWPAVGLYLLFLWMEMAWDGSDSPSQVATAIVAYAAVTWMAMALFGRQAWLHHGEVFSRVFGVLGRFAPLHFSLENRRIVEWRLRPYAVGLLQPAPAHPSEVALIVVILASVSLDGFLETPAWAAITEGLSEDAAQWPRTLALVATPLLFFFVYRAFCSLVAASSGSNRLAMTGRVTSVLVSTLVPIAIAYQVAHYLSFLVNAGQYIIPLVSDPLGRGWNLFGTANYFVRISIIDARIVWAVSLGAIVVGHVAALYLGHVLALREFPDRAAARRSQAPMLVLMVGYTMLSLWIIAQPIVTSR